MPPTAGLPLELRDLWPRRPHLEERIAAAFDLPPLQLECSGTAALWVALQAARARAPDRTEVVVPGYTCPLVALAIRSLGLDLRLCDLAAGTLDMDPAALTTLCSERTLAVVPTHLGGLVSDVDPAVSIAARVGALVIEDAAQALGARDRSRSVGLRGDVGVFSLAAGKGLSIYEGGLLASRDEALRAGLSATSAACVPGRPWFELRRCVELAGLAVLYRPRGLVLAYGLGLRRALERGDLLAAVGDDFSSEIPVHRVSRWRRGVGTRAAERLPAFLERVRAQARRRIPELERIPGIHVIDERPDTRGTWPFLIVELPDAGVRDAALARLWRSGLGVSRLFIHALPDYAILGEAWPDGAPSRADVPCARTFADRTLTITNSPWLDDARFERICTELRALAV